MARDKIMAGTPLPANRTYPEELVARIKHRYLTYKVLGYLDRPAIIQSLSNRFGIDVAKMTSLLQYEGMR